MIIFYLCKLHNLYGWLAQLVRAPALQAGGHKFESYITHHLQKQYKNTSRHF